MSRTDSYELPISSTQDAEYQAAVCADRQAEIETLRRKLSIATQQWDNWRTEAVRLNARLQKLEPESPMVLNEVKP